ncbi:MAG: hypothetical protein HOV80_00015 [Polyangiaceae bacterium]|nr:hypothetical protein [Polyangiaceae bacterium]
MVDGAGQGGESSGVTQNSTAVPVRIREPASSASALRSGLAEALDEALDRLAAERNGPAGLLWLGSDAARIGADALSHPTRSRAEASCRAERAAVDRIATSPKPVVAVLHGDVDGTSFEVALACRARIAVEGTACSLAFSDTEFGLAPRLGGLARVVATCGIGLAVDLAARGRRLDAQEALALGLIDAIVPASSVDRHAAELAQKMSPSAPRISSTTIEGARHELRVRHGGNYPALVRALDVIEALAQKRPDLAAEMEVFSFGELAMSTTAKNLAALRGAALSLERHENAPTGGAIRSALASLGLGYAAHAHAVALPFRRFAARIFSSLETEARRLIAAGASASHVRSALRAWGFLGQDPAVDEKPSAGRRIAPEIVQMRCALPLVLEALRALEAGVIPSPLHGDVAAVFLGGFPPFRGGPFRYVDDVGPREIVARADVLAREHGPAFVPPPLLRSLAERGARLYPSHGS